MNWASRSAICLTIVLVAFLVLLPFLLWTLDTAIYQEPEVVTVVMSKEPVLDTYVSSANSSDHSNEPEIRISSGAIEEIGFLEFEITLAPGMFGEFLEMRLDLHFLSVSHETSIHIHRVHQVSELTNMTYEDHAAYEQDPLTTIALHSDGEYTLNLLDNAWEVSPGSLGLALVVDQGGEVAIHSSECSDSSSVPDLHYRGFARPVTGVPVGNPPVLDRYYSSAIGSFSIAFAVLIAVYSGSRIRKARAAEKDSESWSEE